MCVDVLNCAGSRIYSSRVYRIALAFIFGKQVNEGDLFVARELREVRDMALRDDHEVVGDPAAVPDVIFESVFDYQEMRALDWVCEFIAIAKHARIASGIERSRLSFAV